MFQKHYSDTLLLRHLDGELSAVTEWRVARHLKACWRCRNRLGEIQEMIRAAEQDLVEADRAFSGPDWLSDGMERFSDQVRRFDQELLQAPKFGQFSRPVVGWAMAAAAVLGFVIAAAVLLRPTPPSEPGFEQIVAATRRTEEVLSELPVHQAFRVEVRQIQPVVRVRSSRLEVWSDPKGVRYSSRWSALDGTLKHAVWHDGPDRGYEYDSGRGPAVVKTAAPTGSVHSFVEIAASALRMDELEAAFLNWLRHRSWRPVSFTGQLTGFRSEDGVEVRIHKIRAPEGERYQLSLSRRIDGRLAELVVEVDSQTYRPRLKRLRLDDGEKAVEVVLVAERFRAVSPGRLELAVFRPDRSLLPAPPAGRSLPAPPPPAPPAIVVEPIQQDPSSDEVKSSHLRLAYALHRAQLCLAGEIEIIEVWGGLLVRGVVADPERRAEYEAVLNLAAAPEWVTFDVTTPEETAASLAAQIPASEPAEIHASGGRLPIEDELISYIQARGAVEPHEVSLGVASFANRVVSQSGEALRRAWAVRRLTEQDPFGVKDLSPEQQRLVEAMIQDHVHDLDEQLLRIRAQLTPFLSVVVPEPVEITDELVGRTSSSLPGVVLRIFEQTKILNENILALFAGEGLPADFARHQTPDAPVRVKSAEEVARELLTTLTVLPSQVVELGTRLAENPSRLSATGLRNQ